MVQLVRIFDTLPEGLEALRAEASAEGYRHMDRLATDWAAGVQRFDGAGEALLAGFLSGDLVAIGGLTREPKPAEEPALRMRRLFVSAQARRSGVARAIASALVQEGFGADLITVHAGDRRAEAFWEAQGFRLIAGRPWSHELRR